MRGITKGLSSPIKPRVRNGAQQIGLVLLGIGTAAGIHSAMNPSFYTLYCFSGDNEKSKYARAVLNETLIVGALVSAGIGLVFRDWIVGIATMGGFAYFNIRARMALATGLGGQIEKQ